MDNQIKKEIIDINRSTLLYGVCIGVAFCLMLIYITTQDSNWFAFILFLILVLNVIDTYISYEKLKKLLEKREDCYA